MRIVLSRKGFDSQYGGVPSPILEDGTLVPLPIPSRNDPHVIGKLWPQKPWIGKLASDLTNGRIDAGSRVHLDPDLDRTAIARAPDWRSSFGQIAAAQSHLAKNAVGTGDLFLFFGWFRQAECVCGRWRYVAGAPDLHIVFGWLQIDVVVPIARNPETAVQRFPWLAFHPHVARAAEYSSPNNTIYVARQHLRLDGLTASLPGAGLIERFHTRVQLTAPGQTRSVWRLPRDFLPQDGEPPLSYHHRRERWTIDGDAVLLRSVAKGQEFVVDTERCYAVERWAASLIGG